MEVYKKISQAIQEIKKSDLKKAGRNTFSNYDYYTPDQISVLVTTACNKLNLLPMFNLKRNELGITGELTIINLDKERDVAIYEMASAIPEIKATNIAQQLGGAMTYTKRYMLMNVFDITDNTLDFDNTPTPAKNKKEPKNDQNEPTEWLNLFSKQGAKTNAFEDLEKAIAEGKKYTLVGIRNKYKVSKEVANQLKNNFNIS